MVRTQIQLTEEQYENLKRVARLNNVSMSELIRKKVDDAVNSLSSDRAVRKIIKAKSIAGQFGSGQKNLSENHDYYLTEAFKQ